MSIIVIDNIIAIDNIVAIDAIVAIDNINEESMNLEDILIAHNVAANNTTEQEDKKTEENVVEHAPQKRRRQTTSKASKESSSFVTIRITESASDALHRLQTAILVSKGRKESLGDIIKTLIERTGDIYGTDVEKMMKKLK